MESLSLFLLPLWLQQSGWLLLHVLLLCRALQGMTLQERGMRRERRYSLPRSVCRSTLLLCLRFSRCSGDRQLMSQQRPSDVLWMQRVEELVIWIWFARSELDNFNKKSEVRLIDSEPLVCLPFVLE